MSHGRPPRRQRRISLNPIALARNNAARLTVAEIALAINPLRAAAKALREGVATEWEWAIVASAMNVAQAIERQGIVKGLAEHLRSAEVALQAIERRAMAPGAWKATALYYQELDHIATAVDLHEYQLQQLSYGEFRRVVVCAEAEIRSAGGRVVDVGQMQGVLA
jgi:hypothetical protein